MKHILLFLFTVLVLIGFATALYPSIEGFVTKQQTDEEKINTTMTFLEETLCPAIKAIVDDFKRDITEGTEQQKKIQVLKTLTKEANGPLFSCPAPTKALDVPANIGDQVKTTANYLEPKLKDLMDSFTRSLDCPKEGFVESKTQAKQSQQTQQTQQKSNIPKELTQQEKDQIYKTRADALALVLTQKSITQKLANIKVYTKKILQFKSDAEAGRIRTNCA